MIKYKDAEPSLLLPDNFNDTDMKALSYAVRYAVGKLMAFKERTRLLADLENTDEEILDLLALELNTQYYDRALPPEKKRDLIRRTLVWYRYGGTVSAVQEQVDILFGYGEVVEWDKFEDGQGAPGEFEIVTSFDIPNSALKGLSSIIDRVKRLSAHLRSVRMQDAVSVVIKYGNAVGFEIEWGPRQTKKHLDGTWKLDGKELLSGYKQGESDVSPLENMTFAVPWTVAPEGGEALMTKEKILDGTWSLDGKTKLDGGKYIL